MSTNTDMSSTMNWSIVREAIKKYGMRNSNCMAIAPTATISNIAGSVPGIEPIYKNIYVKANISGDFIIVNTALVKDLKQRGLWNKEMLDAIKYHDGSLRFIPDVPADLKEKYKETFEIDMRWLVKAAQRRGKWVDQSQSLNIFYAGTSGKEISDLYLFAWEAGVKTTYYLRTLGASQVEKSTINTAGTQIRKKMDEEVKKTPIDMPTPSPLATPSPIQKQQVDAGKTVAAVKTSAQLTPQQESGALRGRNQAFLLTAESPSGDTILTSHSSLWQTSGLTSTPLVKSFVHDSGKKVRLYTAPEAVCESCQ
jgi:ribonucleoside-diphosphate reductase alpha chain